MSNQPNEGSVIFYDSCPPPLKAGEYTLEVTQQLQDADDSGSEPKNDIHIDKQGDKPLPGTLASAFEITGPRFLLQADEIHAVFPPANADGPFEGRLPCAVLKRRTLPWERTSGTSNTSEQPWLALLLFTEDEVTLLDPPSCTVESVLSHKPFSWTGEPADNAANTLYHTLNNTEKNKGCLGIEVSVSLFQEIAPLKSELPLLTHVRQVNTDDKELLGQDKDGWFSVVVANRMPLSGKKYIACLVSLEGQESLLPTEHAPLTQPRNATPGIGVSQELSYRTQVKKSLYNNNSSINFTSQPAPDLENEDLANENHEHRVRSAAEHTSAPSPSIENASLTAAATHNNNFVLPNVSIDESIKPRATGLYEHVEMASWFTYNPNVGTLATPAPTIKLICLARWSFQCEGKGDFEGLMKALPESGGIGLVGMTEAQSTNEMTTPSNKHNVALDSGHIPLQHQTRDGEQKTSFYRGPLVPAGVQRNINEGPYHTSDQARRIDPLTGLENLGYASAFELGRLMALNDSRFALELLKWRRKGHQRASKLIQGALIQRKLKDLIPHFDPREFLDHRRLIDELLGDIAPRILTEDLLGTLTDPTGLLDIMDRLPGLDGQMVMEALGLEAHQVEAMLGTDLQSGLSTGGLINNGNLIDEVGLTNETVLAGGFENLLSNAETEFGRLNAEHINELGDFDAFEIEGLL
ncbi:MAG: hypothetical protein KUG73_08470 [Pseudomonadales bacterium]|nr:hypothetical protein [Pseudomonadales bacterium]